MIRLRDRPRRVAARALAALLCAGLSACGPGGPAPRASTPEGGPAPVETVWTADGGPRATLLALHGYGDHGLSTYGEAAESWRAAGFDIVAYDQRGFGANADRGAWPGAEALIADFAARTEAAKEMRPDRPLIVIGHSMGAGVALAAIGEGRAPAVDAVVLAAPAIAGGRHVSALERLALWALTAAAPDRRWTGRGVVRIQASDDVAMLRRLAADPLRVNNPSGRELSGLVRIMDRAAAAAPGVTIPSLTLVGARDEVVSPAAMQAVAATLGGAPTLRVYDEGWHMLFRDLQKERVWDDVAAWAAEAVAGGGS